MYKTQTKQLQDTPVPRYTSILSRAEARVEINARFGAVFHCYCHVIPLNW